jgi:hypothetical protein
VRPTIALSHSHHRHQPVAKNDSNLPLGKIPFFILDQVAAFSPEFVNRQRTLRAQARESDGRFPFARSYTLTYVSVRFRPAK